MKIVRVNIICFLLLLFSCTQEAPRYTVPVAPVHLRVDLHGYDFVLQNALSYKIYTEKERRFDDERFGFAGILVVSDVAGETLYAYDLCCPYEDRREVTVDPEYEGSGRYNGRVKCPVCGTVFVTMFGQGSVASGPSKEPLQRYSVVPLSDGRFQITR